MRAAQWHAALTVSGVMSCAVTPSISFCNSSIVSLALKIGWSAASGFGVGSGAWVVLVVPFVP
jgi:hypothetical protein